MKLETLTGVNKIPMKYYNSSNLIMREKLKVLKDIDFHDQRKDLVAVWKFLGLTNFHVLVGLDIGNVLRMENFLEILLLLFIQT